MKPFSKSILQFFPRKIWHQTFIIFALLVVIPLTVLGLLLIHTSKNAIKTSVLENHKEVAIHATGEVREHLASAQQALSITASILGILHADAWRQETAIIELSLKYPAFQRIVSIDTNGHEVASSQLGVALLDQSNHPAFLKAKEGKSYISQVDTSMNFTPMVAMSVPIRQLGKIKGVLMAEFNLRGMWDIVDRIKFGETGRAYLIDQDGRIVAHPDKKLVFKNIAPLQAQLVQDIAAGRAGNQETYQGGNGWLVSYAPIKNLGWGLVIFQSQKEAYSFSRIMQIQSWILIVFSVIATVFISFSLSQFVTRPINNLIQGTQRLANGDFNHSFRIQRRDEIGRLLFSFNRMTAKLRKAQQVEKLSIIGKAATAIAHELKNSLVLVKTFVHLMPERHKDRTFIKEFSDTVPKELESWNQMLRNMMDFSKNSNFAMMNVNVNDIVADVASLAKFRAGQSNIQFDVHLSKNLPDIKGNKDKLKQVFLNLITNSLEATPKNGSICMSTDLVLQAQTDTESCVEVKVYNSPSYSSDVDIERIFEPFYTTKDHGLGLGLSISQEILKQHGGRIRAVNEKDQGTLFSVRIPVDVRG